VQSLIGVSPKIGRIGQLQQALQREAIHVGIARYKPKSLIQPVSCLARWPRSEIYRYCAALTGLFDGEQVEGFANAIATRIAVYHYVFNPCSQAGWYAKHCQRERTRNAAIYTGDEHKGRWRLHHFG
jgi:hypothetical protein